MGVDTYNIPKGWLTQIISKKCFSETYCHFSWLQLHFFLKKLPTLPSFFTRSSSDPSSFILTCTFFSGLSLMLMLQSALHWGSNFWEIILNLFVFFFIIRKKWSSIMVCKKCFALRYCSCNEMEMSHFQTHYGAACFSS